MATNEKPYLLGIQGELAEQKFALGFGQTTVGRDVSQCQIVLAQDFISRVQAVIDVNENGQAAIKNLSSRQTTFVNDQPIDACFIKDDDKIEFGAGERVSFIFRQPAFRDEATPFVPPKSATSLLRLTKLARLRIGRAPDNEIVLDAPSVSRRHAELIYENGKQQPVISDAGSANGTFVNGDALRSPRELLPTDWVTIGGYLLRVSGREVIKHDFGESRIAAFNICKDFDGKRVLQDISVALYPREFIGLMGTSGCGKSTLMDALNGLRPATSGQVLINDLDLYTNFDLFRRSIGYVPQRDILHEALTVERTLYYSAKMRLPSGATAAQIDAAVNDVIKTVGLEEQRENAFRELSGGQQKRLSLGIELITKPNFLFLDEPTSPLDPETTENMMMLFRRLADEGRIVVMVTHKFEKFNSMHNIVLLTKGGRLAFFGPPKEAMQYFNCTEPGEIYRRLSERQPEELSRAFQRSEPFKKYVAVRFDEMRELVKAGGGSNPKTPMPNAGAEREFGFGQWLTLARRYLEIKWADSRNTLLLLAQAPIVALILAFITDSAPNDGRTVFIAAVIAIWFGANNAIREIVAETPIYARERLVNLKIPSYVLSKFAVLSGIGFIQCFLFVLILTVFGRFEVVDFPMLTLVLYLTLLAGVAIGLFFSALVSSTEKAMSILPLILIPQLLLSGFLKPLDDLYVNVQTGMPAAMSERKSSPNSNNLINKTEGLGVARPAADLMTARWTIDALAHQVSFNDPEARDKLAAQMTVKEYDNVLQERSENVIEEAYENRVTTDLWILAAFSVLFLALTMMILKRKDSL